MVGVLVRVPHVIVILFSSNASIGNILMIVVDYVLVVSNGAILALCFYCSYLW